MGRSDGSSADHPIAFIRTRSLSLELSQEEEEGGGEEGLEEGAGGCSVLHQDDIVGDNTIQIRR